MPYHTMTWARIHYDELSDYEKGLVDDGYEREREAYLERKYNKE